MIPARYFVVKVDGHWRVEFESNYWNGRHETKSEAIETAKNAARQHAVTGRPAEVLVQAENKVWYTEWTNEDI